MTSSNGTMRLSSARYSLICSAAVAMLAASLAFLSLTSLAKGQTYPIPFRVSRIGRQTYINIQLAQSHNLYLMRSLKVRSY